MQQLFVSADATIPEKTKSLHMHIHVGVLLTFFHRTVGAGSGSNPGPRILCNWIQNLDHTDVISDGLNTELPSLVMERDRRKGEKLYLQRRYLSQGVVSEKEVTREKSCIQLKYKNRTGKHAQDMIIPLISFHWVWLL